MAEFGSHLKPDVETDNLFQQKCYLLNEAIQDTVAAITFGTVCNYSTFFENPVDQSLSDDKKEAAQKEQPSKAFSTTSWDKKGYLTKNRAKTSPKKFNIRGSVDAWERVNKPEEPLKNGGGFVPASVRLRWLQDGSTHLKSLLEDLQTYIMSLGQAHGADESKRTESAQGGRAKPGTVDYDNDKKEEERLNAKEKERRVALAALRGRVNRNLFVNHCGLNLKPSDFVSSARGLPVGSYSPKGGNERLTKSEAVGNSGPAGGDLLKQLTELVNRTEKLRVDIVSKVQPHSPQGESPGQSRIFRAPTKDEKDTFHGDEKGTTAPPAGQENRNAREGARKLCGSLHTLSQLLQKNLLVMFERIIKAGTRVGCNASPNSSTTPNVLTELMMAGSNGHRHETSLVPSCSELSSLPSLIKEIAAWPEPLLGLINTCISAASPAVVSEAPRERLRRLAFDVEELQLEQEKAVTDGDMQRSEEIYYQQTTLLNSMVPIFSAFEKTLETYKMDVVSKPLEKITTFRSDFVNRQQECLRREEDALNRVRADREKLLQHRKKLLVIRAGQDKGLENYLEEWDNLYNTSVLEQAGCLRTMDQLERRMRELCKEQQFLVQDRLLKLKEEYQRREDTAAFESFATEHGAVLSAAEETLSVLVENIKAYTMEVQHSFEHLEAYICNDVTNEIEGELLQMHKDRLEQFRQLYTTLGDLQFKKARHLEEVEKKISNYEMYQEVAMDTLNPKAKVYSQAKKSWEGVHKEVQQQLDVLNRQCEAEIASFKRTEQALLMAGVTFTNPVEEVAMRNQQRQQKLLEYRQLMESETQKQTLSEIDKLKNGVDINETKEKPSGLEARAGDSKKSRDAVGSPRLDSSTGSPSSNSRRLPFLFSKGKSSKTRKDFDSPEALCPSSHHSDLINSPNGVTLSSLMSNDNSSRPQCLHSIEEKITRHSPVTTTKK